MKATTITFVLFFCIRGLIAQISQEWMRTADAQFSNAPVVTATDQSGNCYIAGTTGDQMNWVITGMALAKYDPSGTELWSTTFSGLAPWGITVDGSGNVIVAGEGNPQTSNVDGRVVVYNSSGQLQWSQSYATSNIDFYHSVAADANGNIYCAGGTYSGSSWSSCNALLVAYSSAGQQLWSNTYGLSSVGESFGKVIVNNGSVYAAGGGDASAFVVNYSATNGNQTWAGVYSGASNMPDHFADVAVDGSGNVYATGGTTIVGGKGNRITRDGNILTVKYSSTGAQQWVKTYDGTGSDAASNPSYFDQANSLALDGSDNVYVSGRAYNKVGSKKNVSSSYDYVTIKYTPSGSQSWLQSYGQNNVAEQPSMMVSDGSGLIITGRADLTPVSTLTIKYDFSGNLEWAQVFNNSGTFSMGSSLAVSGSDIFVGVIADSIILVKYAPPSLEPMMTGIEESATTPFSIHPNPTNGILHLSGNRNQKLGLVEVINLSGQVVLNQQAANISTELDLSSLKPGMYFIHIENFTEALKVVKQ